MIPRIQGKIGQGDEPGHPHHGKWFFTVWFSTLGGGEAKEVGTFGPWETEQIAKDELKKACRLGCEALEEKLGGDGKPSGHYIDMKTNELRPWDEQ